MTNAILFVKEEKLLDIQSSSLIVALPRLLTKVATSNLIFKQPRVLLLFFITKSFIGATERVRKLLFLINCLSVQTLAIRTVEFMKKAA